MRGFTTRRITRLFSLTLLMAALAIVQAHAKTDFSGTWKLNTSKSEFGQMPPPDSLTEKIAHQDPDLKANVVSTGGMMGDQTYDVAYSTDGKETANKVGENEFKSTGKWDGDQIVIDTKGSFSGTEFTSKDHWELSRDGKTLTVSRHLSSAMGEMDMKMVFEKQ
ncbi:MAG TPA: hypothetical protein VKR61_00900 [Bryobacteraceae bacterium]|nr:hypothetical protein [Bryobacteraceae bacterium]